KQQIALIEKEKTQALLAIKQKWEDIAKSISEVPIIAQKKDVLLELFGVAWMPFYLVRWNDREQEVPAFKA
ncbi:MAG: hypothetical protein ACPL7A_03770, partial [Anaerolineales bacterium]